MRRDEGVGRVRERPPLWRRHEPEPEPEQPPRGLRARERLEDGGLVELYPGAIAMEDFGDDLDEAAQIRILARYTVVRLTELCAAGLAGSPLRNERRIAREHVLMLSEHDWERRQLEHVVRLCRQQPVRPIVEPLIAAAEAAAKRGHLMGAFGLYRAGYELALQRSWWSDAARMARGVTYLARLECAPRSERRWSKRAWILMRRAEKQAAAEAEA